MRRLLVFKLTEASHQFTLIVILLASLARLSIFFKLGGTAFYFPDSWNYLVVPWQGQTPSSIHSPFIWLIWRIFTLGNITENNVLLFHSILGIASTTLLSQILVRYLKTQFALAITFLYILSPWQYFFERTILPETVGLFLIISIFWLCSYLSKIRLHYSTYLVCAGTGACLGILVAIKQSYLLLGIVFMIFLFFKIALNKSMSKKVLLVLAGCFGIPIFVLSAHYQASYGVFSPSPSSGTILMSRWGSLVPCEQSQFERSPLVRKAIEDVCEQDPGEFPGAELGVMWNKENISLTKDPSEEFAPVQERLRVIAIQAIWNEKAAFLNRLIGAFFYPLLNNQLHDDLKQYLIGDEYLSSATVKSNFTNMTLWRESAVLRSSNSEVNGSLSLRNAVENTIWLPHALFVLVVLLLLKLIITPLNITRTFSSDSELIGILSVAFIVIVQLTIAMFGVNNFRYYLGLIPVSVMLVCFLCKDSSFGQQREFI